LVLKKHSATTSRSRAIALCAASDEATAIRDDVSFFQAMQAALNKQSSTNRKTPEQIDAAIRQLVSKPITTEGQVTDVFTAAGFERPPLPLATATAQADEAQEAE
jgi:type I restriction enzyme R subunit